MELKDQWQVASLELSKELEKLGYKQESIWWWNIPNERNIEGKPYIAPYSVYAKYELIRNQYEGYWSLISAPTCAELGKVLPNAINIYILRCMKTKKGEHICQYRANDEEGGGELCYTQDKTEANAKASMKIYLLKNNLIPKGDK